MVISQKREDGSLKYLKPDDLDYIENLLKNWRGKICEIFDEQTAKEAVLLTEVQFYHQPYRSRLVYVKKGTSAETKLKGYYNFKLKLTAERRFIELLCNAGAGLGNAQGQGYIELLEVMGKEVRLKA